MNKPETNLGTERQVSEVKSDNKRGDCGITETNKSIIETRKSIRTCNAERKQVCTVK